MEGRKSYVVIENRGAMGLAIIRHPYATRELAEARAVEEAGRQSGSVFYTAELQDKFVGTVIVEAERLR